MSLHTDAAAMFANLFVCQTIPPAPLHPIPVIGEPFEHVLTDCVGSLPQTKSGNQYLLTVMCTAITVLISPAVDELGSGTRSDAFFRSTFPNSGTMLLPDGNGLTSARLASVDYPGRSADALR